MTMLQAPEDKARRAVALPRNDAPPADDRPLDDDRRIDGDVSTHLEDLLIGELEPLDASAPEAGAMSGASVTVELVGPHLRVAGTFDLGRFRRLSDFLNNQVGLMALHRATVLRRNGDPTKVTARHIWVSPAEVTIIGQTDEVAANGAAPPEFRIPKRPEGLIIVTPGHTLTGQVYIPLGGDLSIFVESPDPAFLPMTDVRTRSLADRRIIARYDFAMLNRRHVVAATPLQAGMAPGRRVL